MRKQQERRKKPKNKNCENYENCENRETRKPRKSRKLREQRKPRKRENHENRENCENAKHENYENRETRKNHENCESIESRENAKTAKTRKPRKRENREKRKTPRRLALLAAFLGFLGFLVSRFLASHRSGHVAWISCLGRTGGGRGGGRADTARKTKTPHVNVGNCRFYPFFQDCTKRANVHNFYFRKSSYLQLLAQAATCSHVQLRGASVCERLPSGCLSKWLPEQVASKWLPEQVVAKWLSSAILKKSAFVEFTLFSTLHKACKRASLWFSKKQLLAAACASNHLQPLATTWGKCLRASNKFLDKTYGRFVWTAE